MPQSIDIDITARDIASLLSADALAAFFTRLGYPTGGRTSLARGALGLVDESAVRKLELLARTMSSSFASICTGKVGHRQSPQ